MNKSLVNSHNVFHKKYSYKTAKQSGRKSHSFMKCFPCILKIRELLDINFDPGFKDMKSFLEYLEEVDQEKDLKKQKKKNKEKYSSLILKKKYNSQIVKFTKLSCYLKELYDCSDAFNAFNDFWI